MSLLVIIVFEDSGAHYQPFCSCFFALTNCRVINPAIDFQCDILTTAGQRANFFKFRKNVRYERLTAKPCVNTHHQDHIAKVDDVVKV